MNPAFTIPLQKIELKGYGIRLMPLSLDHAEALKEVAADGQLWNLSFTTVPEPGGELSYIEAALKGYEEGHMLPFVVFDEHSNKIIGTTRYHDIIGPTARLEIGYTWYGQSHWRSHVNTVCKYLLLFYAFEELKANTVGWRTDNINHRSQNAIQRLGAKLDGVIRGHFLRRDGTIRDTYMYSMIAAEWPAIKATLESKLPKA